jgi:hypothetical protein
MLRPAQFIVDAPTAPPDNVEEAKGFEHGIAAGACRFHPSAIICYPGVPAEPARHSAVDRRGHGWRGPALPVLRRLAVQAL